MKMMETTTKMQPLTPAMEPEAEPLKLGMLRSAMPMPSSMMQRLIQRRKVRSLAKGVLGSILRRGMMGRPLYLRSAVERQLRQLEQPRRVSSSFSDGRMAELTLGPSEPRAWCLRLGVSETTESSCISPPELEEE